MIESKLGGLKGTMKTADMPYEINKKRIVREIRMFQSIFTKSSEFASFESLSHDEVVLVLPYIDHDLAVKVEEILRVRADHPGLLVLVDDDERMGFIQVANYVYMRSKSPFFGYLAQDAYPGMYWLEQGMNALKQSDGGLMAFNEGRFFGTVAAFGLARRAWLSSLYRNMLFYPGYKSQFGDTELSAIAFAQNKFVFNPNALLIEVDYEKHHRVNSKEDDALYKARLATQFDGLAPTQK
jgi:hypothetical protein